MAGRDRGCDVEEEEEEEEGVPSEKGRQRWKGMETEKAEKPTEKRKTRERTSGVVGRSADGRRNEPRPRRSLRTR